MTIVVGGYIVAYPLGGMSWHHLNYLLGLHEMGHEVWFLEDSGDFALPYNPRTKMCEVDSSFGRAYLERTFRQFGLPLRYCYYSEFEDQHFGLNESELTTLLKRADALICVSGVTPLRASRPRPRRTLVVDTDPVFTQLRMAHDANFSGYYKQFDACATFARLIGTPACPLPMHGIRWIPTNQPISLKHWPVRPPRAANSGKFTTIGKWEHATDRRVEFQGQTYLSSKAVEWERLIDLPKRSTWKLYLAMQAMPQPCIDRFQSHGWTILDAEEASVDCRTFQDFIAGSAGELTVAKQIYARLPSGWFSDRSAAYLATGRPVVAQGSGFDRWLPTGRGLFSFQTSEEAADALRLISEDYLSHTAAARTIAEQYFDSRVVLNELLNQLI
jgi:hypothetical protein